MSVENSIISKTRVDSQIERSLIAGTKIGCGFSFPSISVSKNWIKKEFSKIKDVILVFDIGKKKVGN